MERTNYIIQQSKQVQRAQINTNKNNSDTSSKSLLPLPSNYKIFDNFIYFRKFVIGTGSFGKVLYGMNLERTQNFAIKFEKSTVKSSVIGEEVKILSNLRGGVGIPEIFWYGKHEDYKVMVMDLLGPSLDKFFKVCDRKFTIETTVNLGIEMLNRIEYVHSKGYLHRDIKPNNFLLGKFRNNVVDTDNTVYIVDFGLSKTYIDPNTNRHYEYSDASRFVGTPRYASINTHSGIRQSRRDDLESIIYILIYFLKSELPWQGIRAKTKSEKKEKIKNCKKSASPAELCDGLPNEFSILLTYVLNLGFEETPDYESMRNQLKQIKTLNNFTEDLSYVEWEWNKMFLESKELYKIDDKFVKSCKKHYEKLYEGYPVPTFDEFVYNLENKKVNSTDDKTSFYEIKEETKDWEK